MTRTCECCGDEFEGGRKRRFCSKFCRDQDRASRPVNKEFASPRPYRDQRNPGQEQVH